MKISNRMHKTTKGMRRGDFRIESDCGVQSSRWGTTAANEIIVHDRSLAVTMAAKSLGIQYKGEIRVVYAPTGEVIFRKHA
jgi:hypothetical protein